MIKREITDEIKVPYEVNDEHFKYLTDIIVEQQKKIDKLEKDFKKPLSEAKEKRDEAIKELTEGKDEEVRCFLYIDVKKGIVRKKEVDTGELLEERKATDIEIQPQMNDLEVEKEK
jgi:hypothetical protein